MMHLLKCRGELCTFRWSLQIQFRWCIPPKRLLKLHRVHPVSNYSLFFLTPWSTFGHFLFTKTSPKINFNCSYGFIIYMLEPNPKSHLVATGCLHFKCCLFSHWFGLVRVLVVQCFGCTMWNSCWLYWERFLISLLAFCLAQIAIHFLCPPPLFYKRPPAVVSFHNNDTVKYGKTLAGISVPTFIQLALGVLFLSWNLLCLSSTTLINKVWLLLHKLHMHIYTIMLFPV